ncbi:uncharacterized protein NECHADRAFT_48219 [Fusarium vanettenii 77-13-4]|uniref:Reverse transcriptase domain-containing protein n=1 Tax=Fusarium vanettenii (strain ATCC MYA-4622 / CBS 123669 / FGSC 9596 / NRRL 45880 / 77-13-4) TaxID=660122 RepID=C7ZD75_FUSV7|nr:uncharacterized protein NECHADRAFT_48219 [Fusarium vanettenii 77-13-4]EEU38042.1 hypothetical protein NECHADRAFT_48219 [Fusarium vanettenii 77-13-4]
MVSSGSVFSATLQEITNTKLDELSKRRSRFEEAKSSILASIQTEDDAVKRVITLSDGVKKCFDIKLDKTGKVMTEQTGHGALEIELKNLDRFLDQAKCDPSVSSKMLDAWQKSLLRHLDMQSLQFQYAALYAQLVTEWLSGDKEEEGAGDDVEMGEPFEDVGSAAKLESRMKWEGVAFEAADVDETALKQYLDHLFGVDNKHKKYVASALKKLRRAVYAFEAQLSTPNQFSVQTLGWVIRGLLSSDLLSDEKREVLRDFQGNHVILKEIADVLDMRISALGSWNWSSDAVPLEMRRKISGVYNVHLQEDLLNAIFLQYIGVKWSVFFKGVFQDFRDCEDAWKSTRADIPKIDKRRLGYYLGPLSDSPSLQSARTKIYNSKFFMTQLMDNLEQGTEDDDDDEDEDDSYDDDEDDEDDEPLGERNPMTLKQDLLHLLSTEININTQLYGELTAFHSVFDNWNSLLPHQTVCTILEYFGVSEKWLGFFKRFLEAPLKFVDDENATPRQRRRGAPTSHVLSDVFGETVLFCLDFAVNQSTSGNRLWRVKDDVWFWTHDHKMAVKTWEVLDEFKTITSTEINTKKSGTIRVAKDRDMTLSIDESLPEGEIRWGFLRLSPQTGRFEIDQKMVDSHIDELHKQLHDKRKSILAFIQTWNSYAATFFTSNFGKAANCFGQEHVDNMLSTHERIQRQVFSKLSGDGEEKVTSVAEYLKKEMSRRFGIENIPDGFLYFPVDLGGLDLQSPFVSLLQIREQVYKSPLEPIIAFEEAEVESYKRAEKAFLNGSINNERYSLDDPDWKPKSEHDQENFMPFDEYIRYREDFEFNHYRRSQKLRSVFRRLMTRPEEKSIDKDDGKVCLALDNVSSMSKIRSWHGMEPYWRWVAMVYGPEIVDRFGELNIVDSGLLPMGMVSVFRNKRVKW